MLFKHESFSWSESDGKNSHRLITSPVELRVMRWRPLNFWGEKAAAVLTFPATALLLASVWSMQHVPVVTNVVCAPQPLSEVWSINVSLFPNIEHPVGQLCFASKHLCNQQLAWRPIENQALSSLCLSLTHLQQPQSKLGGMARSEWLLKKK